jgi:hypothetical protein
MMTNVDRRPFDQARRLEHPGQARATTGPHAVLRPPAWTGHPGELAAVAGSA